MAEPTHPRPLPIALTMGDPAGIGPEITAKAWQDRRNSDLPPFFVIASSLLYQGMDLPVEAITHPLQALNCFKQALPVLELPEAAKALPGKPSPSQGAMTIYSIRLAVELVQSGKASSVVTNPINKHVLYEAGFAFPGHTEYLADLAKARDVRTVRPVMMLACTELRTVPLTIHIPLREVPERITKELIVETGLIVSNDLKKYFALKHPRLAFAGLNPHAGENGAMGTEEGDILEPALDELRQKGIEVTGPHPADTLFHEQARQNYDVVIGMYHDQALIPMKTLGFDKGVNTTLGLPFVRTSPDHGTAYNIAGKGVANPQSLIEALKMAHAMSLQAQKCADL